MNKRGLSHVEFIVSFVLFIGFLITSIYFFNPIDNSKIVKSSVDYVFESITSNITTNMETINIVLNPDLNKKVIGIPLTPENGESVNGKAEGEEGNSLDSYFSSGVMNVDRISTANKFIKVRFSDDLNQGNSFSGEIIDGSNFTVSSIEKNEVISEKRLNQLINAYQGDYDYLKETLNIPSRMSFSFELDLGLGNVILVNRDIPWGSEIFSREKRFEFLKEDGSTTFGTFRVRVW